MRAFLIILSITVFAFGVDKSDVYRAYKQKRYREACTLGAKIYLYNKKDNDFLTMFADACLKVDNINRMAFPAMLLIRDAAARSNSVYFLTILYQKKLLYKSLIDGFDVSSYKFPTTNYILSKIFVKYAKKDYKKFRDIYIFKDDTDINKKYEMSLIKDRGVFKIVLKTFINNSLQKTRIYW